jgi:hypothetical protein
MCVQWPGSATSEGDNRMTLPRERRDAIAAAFTTPSLAPINTDNQVTAGSAVPGGRVSGAAGPNG